MSEVGGMQDTRAQERRAMQREAARAGGLAAALSVLNYCVWWAWDQHPAAVGSGHWYADWQGYGLLAGFVAIGIVLGWLGHPVTAAVVAAVVIAVATAIDWSTGPEAGVAEWQVAVALAAAGALAATVVPGVVALGAAKLLRGNP